MYCRNRYQDMNLKIKSKYLNENREFAKSNKNPFDDVKNDQFVKIIEKIFLERIQLKIKDELISSINLKVNKLTNLINFVINRKTS